ncbi:MAG TPA: hypothetical protein VF221_13460 [Chloroflexota bacterium]
MPFRLHQVLTNEANVGGHGTKLVPLLTFLVGLAIARVLRWLDLTNDLDPALTISELLRKPG